MNAPRRATHPLRQPGSAAVPFVAALPVMIGLMALALDLSYMYTRKSSLQQIADGIALAAASQLNGTKAGVGNAVLKGYSVAKDSYYDLNQQAMVLWDPAVLRLANRSDAPDSDWKDASSISSDAMAAGLVFARVDTTKLMGSIGDPGLVDTLFAGFFGQSATSLSSQAIAGPSSIQVSPLAVCAINANPSATRNLPGGLPAEKIEYGFRRGVNYNLLALGPSAATATAYLVDPIAPGNGTHAAANFTAAAVKPYFCNGTLAFQRISSTLHVTPLTLDVKDWLNARFNDFDTGDHCDKKATMVADADIREYIGNYPSWYMGAATDPLYPAAAASTDRTVGTGRVTVADLGATDPGSPQPGSARDFGPLWSYARAASTGTQYAPSDWHNLYANSNGTTANDGNSSYPSTGVPYQTTGHKLPLAGGLKDRRVLNIPLLDCGASAAASPASVLAVGRFFMSSKATSTVIPGEFAGLLQPPLTPGLVALYK